MIRPTLTALAVAALALASTPAFAGKAEDAFLAKLVGTWSGSGELTGAETGTVDCTMTIRNRSDGVNFRGKCDAGEFGPQSFSGTVGYNDEAARYEAKSPSGDVTLGVKEGSSVVFTITLKGIATGTSVMKLASNKAVIDTIVRKPGDKEDIKSHMVLTK